MRLRLHADAEQELLAAAAWYEAQREGLGEDLVAEVDGALTVVAEAPSVWPTWPELPPGMPSIQRFVLHRFPFAVAYVVRAEEVVVLAITHTSRHPGYWTSRRP